MSITLLSSGMKFVHQAKSQVREQNMRGPAAASSIREATSRQALAWSADGAFLAVTGARAACFDFSGDRPPHPYRRDRDEGPDYIPRVLGFSDGSREKCVAWAPGGAILCGNQTRSDKFFTNSF